MWKKEARRELRAVIHFTYWEKVMNFKYTYSVTKTKYKFLSLSCDKYLIMKPKKKIGRKKVMKFVNPKLGRSIAKALKNESKVPIAIVVILVTVVGIG